MSEPVIITYVNQAAYSPHLSPLVEKSVDNGENSPFASLFFLFFR